MLRKQAALVSAVGTALALAGLLALRTSDGRKDRGAPDRDGRALPSGSVDRPEPIPSSAVRVVLPPPRPHPARWIAFGGGAEPSSNQVSMESDLALATETLGPGGVLLFAGGPGSEGVYVLDDAPPGDPLALELGELLAPHGGRDGRYRPTRLAPHGAATRPAVLGALEEALAEDGPPLVVYVDCHGEGADRAIDNSLSTWGGDPITVRELGELLERARRPVRFIVSACFSGGLGELAFRSAREEDGATERDRCGLFASTWDLEATGCDPDPDRRHHEGYATHFLHALASKRPSGETVRADLDGDGTVTLLEAHTVARIASRGLDVPTSTSERWLRAVAPAVGGGMPVAMPEEDAVIESLKNRLGLTGDEREVFRATEGMFAELESRHARLVAAERRAADELERRRNAARGELLARFPALEDPWHPAFQATLTAARPELARLLEVAETYADYLDALETLDRASNAAVDVALARAPVERLLRALENRRLAARLKRKGGKDWARFERFLECERSRLP